MNYPFFAFEGIDGAGKSTQLKKTAAYLKELNFPVQLTKEPTDAIIGSLIRKALAKDYHFTEPTLALLFAADRFEHLAALEQELSQAIVLTDRYLLSSLSYNSYTLEKSWVEEINKKATLKPDLTFLFDLAPELSLDRIAKRNTGSDLYENLERLKRTRENYLAYQKENPQIILIDASQTEDAIFEEVKDHILNVLNIK